MSPTAAQKQAFEAFTRLGSKRAAARELDIHESTLRDHVLKYERAISLDPAVSSAMQAAGMGDPTILHSGWLKTETASLYFQLPKPEDANTEDVIEQIRAAMEGIPAAPIVPTPIYVDEDLLTLYPIFDLHLGMRAFAEQTGEEYTTALASTRLINGMSQLVSSSPPSGKAVILVGGDFLHHNDATNMTKSGHILDVDTQIDQTIEMAIAALAAAIEIAASRHSKVTVSVIQGNHDRDAYLAVLFAMRERYRDDPRIAVLRPPGEFFILEHGLCLLAAHHGDKAKADRLVMALAHEYPEMWGRTRHRAYFTGHLHHAKLQDVGGVQVEQLRAVAPRDFYAASHAYVANSQMQAITYHKDRGEVSRVKLAL